MKGFVGISAAILYFAFSHSTLAVPPFSIEASQKETSIARYLEEAEDPTVSRSQEDMISAAFKPVAVDVVHKGFSNNAFWYRFSYTSTPVSARPAMLKVGNFHMREISIFAFQHGRLVLKTESGTIRITRDFPHRDFIFQLPASEGIVTDVWFRLRNDGPMKFHPTIVGLEELRRADYTEEWLAGLLLGPQFILAIYNLFLFFSIQDKSYLFYALYTAIFGLLQLNLGGFTLYHWLSEFPGLDRALQPGLTFMTLMTMTMFMSAFLELQRGWLQRTFQSLIAVAVLGAIAASFLPARVGLPAATGFTFPCLAILLLGAVLKYREGFRPARYILIAFVPILCVLGLFAATRFLVLVSAREFHLSVLYAGLPLFTLTESVLMSFALGGRYNILREQKEALRLQAANQIREDRIQLNRELHDVIGSDLSALMFALRREPAPGKDYLAQKLALLLGRLRDMVHLNMMETEFDLRDQMQLHLSHVSAQDFSVTSKIEALQLPLLLSFQMHRIFLEAVTNILRHAKATRLSVRLLQLRRGVLLLIADDGQGFRQRNGNGLAGMFDRARRIKGKLRILSGARGTIVSVFVSGSVLEGKA
ncbi:MAG: hypothetical protein JNM27_01605 [Leptospirales bacterium]|nr:hypothetical protein [Leptospirales bacterium]